jgi:predicted nuclease of predicted toxin-antitoxin system
MRFLADMGVSQRVVTWLQEQGHDATHLRDEGLQKLENGEIFTKAFRESRIILTWDLDFTEILALSKTGTVSAVVFRLMNTRSTHVIARLERVLLESAQDLQEGAIVSVEAGRHRVRLLPLGRQRDGEISR